MCGRFLVVPYQRQNIDTFSSSAFMRLAILAVGFIFVALARSAGSAEMALVCPIAATASGHVVRPDGAKFIGPAGDARGHGCLWGADGSYYEGEFENEIFNHHGRYEWRTDGKVTVSYTGEWRDGLMDGEGVLIEVPTGSRYQGRFERGEFAYGQGRIQFGGEAYYEGGLKGSKRHGEGVLVDPDGNRYEGFFVDDVLLSGKAKAKLSNGRLYEGTYQNGKPSGVGTLTTEDGRYQYSGSVRDGEPHGLGELRYQGGSDPASFNRYIGEFKDGVFNGKGQLDVSNRQGVDRILLKGPFTLTASGRSIPDGDGYALWFSGQFVQGYLQTGQIVCSNGVRYEGELRDFTPHGKGTIFYPSGQNRSFNFINGLPDNW